MVDGRHGPPSDVHGARGAGLGPGIRPGAWQNGIIDERTELGVF